jgi:hypothetical protein
MDIIVFGTNRLVKTFYIKNIHIYNSDIEISSVVKSLGFLFYPHLTMDNQINKLGQILMFHLKNISRIRSFIDVDKTKLLFNAFFTSRLDYVNFHLSNLSIKHLSKLQKIQNYAARIITSKKKSDHVTNVLKDLHWLPVKIRIDFKILCMTYKCLNDLVTPYYKPRVLRSYHFNYLNVPCTSTRVGEKAFSVSVPQLWNGRGEHELFFPHAL